MSGHQPSTSTDDFIKSIRPELVRVFHDRPQFGTAGLMCSFHEGQLVRVELSVSVSQRIAGSTP